jgi:hypothetical protein
MLDDMICFFAIIISLCPRRQLGFAGGVAVTDERFGAAVDALPVRRRVGCACGWCASVLGARRACLG